MGVAQSRNGKWEYGWIDVEKVKLGERKRERERVMEKVKVSLM